MSEDVSDGEKVTEITFPNVPERKSTSIRLLPSSGFRTWLASNRLSIAFNTYHIGKVFLLGVDPSGQLSFSDASFQRAMGLSMHEGTLWMASQKQIWRFENFLDPGQKSQGRDAVFAPMGATTTGMVNLHDVRAGADGVYFVSCQFNCVGKLHDKWSFEPIWMPPFISEFTHGDRCHLNCLALENGKPKYATCFADTDDLLAWRNLPKDQSRGLLIDIQSNEIICDTLNMPHSPQLHQGRLYVANSGLGEFGEIDRKTGQYKPICFIPGFTRGIAFHKNFALVGASKPREHGVFEGNDGTILASRLAQSGAEAECSISIVNLETGEIDHKLQIEGVASEIYDVCALPGYRCPRIVDLESNAMNVMFRPSYLLS